MVSDVMREFLNELTRESRRKMEPLYDGLAVASSRGGSMLKVGCSVEDVGTVDIEVDGCDRLVSVDGKELSRHENILVFNRIQDRVKKNGI